MIGHMLLAASSINCPSTGTHPPLGQITHCPVGGDIADFDNPIDIRGSRGGLQVEQERTDKGGGVPPWQRLPPELIRQQGRICVPSTCEGGRPFKDARLLPFEPVVVPGEGFEMQTLQGPCKLPRGVIPIRQGTVGRRCSRAVNGVFKCTATLSQSAPR